MRKREPKSLIEVAAARAGVRKGTTAAKLTHEWAIAVAARGHSLGSQTAQTDSRGVHAAVQEFCEYWKASERTVWRRLATFREVFPEFETPAELAEAIAPGHAGLAAAMNAIEARLERPQADSGGTVLA